MNRLQLQKKKKTKKKQKPTGFQINATKFWDDGWLFYCVHLLLLLFSYPSVGA